MSVPERIVRPPSKGEGSLLYLRAVALHISGHSHSEIASALEISESTVQAALNSAEGVALINEAKRRLRDNIFGKMEAEIIDLAQRSIENLRQTVEAQFLPGSRGKIHQDGVGLKLLGVLGYTESALGGQKKPGLQVDNELGERILRAIVKADAVEDVPFMLGRDVTEVGDAGSSN